MKNIEVSCNKSCRDKSEPRTNRLARSIQMPEQETMRLSVNMNSPSNIWWGLKKDPYFAGGTCDANTEMIKKIETSLFCCYSWIQWDTYSHVRTHEAKTRSPYMCLCEHMSVCVQYNSDTQMHTHVGLQHTGMREQTSLPTCQWTCICGVMVRIHWNSRTTKKTCCLSKYGPDRTAQWGGCGWGVEWSSSNLKVVSSIPSLLHLHAEVSLGKILNPELPLIEQNSAANKCTVWMCVWLGECKTVL